VPGPYHELARTKVGAQEAERRAIAEAMNGRPARAPTTTTAKEVQTINDYAATFLDKFAASHKPSEQRSKRQILDSHLLPVFGSIRLDAIRQEDIDTFVNAERKRGCAVKTVNIRLGVLSSLVKYAIRNGVIRAAERPLTFKVSGMVGELSAVPLGDVEKLLTAATDPRYRVAVLLASEAGLRAGEILGLQWGDIKDGQLTVRRALDKDTGEAIAPKHDKIRHVPLSPRLATSLESLKRLGLWVVSRLDGDPLAYAGLIDAVGLLYDRAKVVRPPKPIHCLRHTFGSNMAGQGVPLPVLQALLGHSDIKTTMRYVDVNEVQKRTAIATVFSRGSHVAAEQKKKPN
jgi:integrase